jgi:hypothetical protein
MNRLRERIVFVGLVALIVAGTLSRWEMKARADRPQLYGSYTNKEIFAKAGPLCRVLDDGEPLQLTLKQDSIYERNGRLHRLWTVDGVELDGDYGCMLVWDADTGELVSAARPSPKPTRSEKKAISKQEAVVLAKYWLDRLGMKSHVGKWSLDQQPERSPSTWYITWKAKNREAFVSVDRLSGELVSARTTSRRTRSKWLPQSI